MKLLADLILNGAETMKMSEEHKRISTIPKETTVN